MADRFDLDEIMARNPDIEVVGEVERGRTAVGGSGGKKRDATRILLNQINLVGIPEPLTKLTGGEHRFHPERNWQVDFCWPDYWLILEIEGGIWQQTKTGRSKGHAHPKRFIEDIEKYNAAVILGWHLLRATPQQVREGEAVGWLVEWFRLNTDGA